MQYVTGTRLRCGSCGSEAIVTRAADTELRCCGAEPEVTFQPAPKED